MKKLTVIDINKMIWPHWTGKIDDGALEERIEELLQNERSLIALQKQLAEVRGFLSPEKRGF